MARRRSASFYVYAGSIVLHATLALGAVLMPKPKRTETVAISLFEQKAKAEEKAKPPPPPPPPPPKPETPKAKAAPAPVAAAAKQADAPPPEAAAPPSAMDGFADLGMALGNAGGGGIAIPTHAARPAGPLAAVGAAAPVPTTKKVRALAARAEDMCDEAPIKPKPRSIVKPVYTQEARAGSVEGVVRVELTVDEEGRVLQARILRGLGYGLDDAALAAAKQMTFEPGTRCGKAAVTTLSLGMRFALGS